MIQVEVATLALDMRGEPVVILRPRADGASGTMLPIWIGVQEANAIMLAQEGATADRPMSYDLMVRLLDALSAAVVRVAVTRLEEGTYFAEITVATGEGERVIDARPSDSIALASRTGAPIFVAEAVMDEAGVTGVVVEDEEDDESQIEEFGKFLDSVDPDDFRG